MSRLPNDVLATLDRAKIVRIETRSAKGTVHQVPIWIVVADGEPYVRSVRGERGRWYRELLARRDGAIRVGEKRIAVRPVHGARRRCDPLRQRGTEAEVLEGTVARFDDPP